MYGLFMYWAHAGVTDGDKDGDDDGIPVVHLSESQVAGAVLQQLGPEALRGQPQSPLRPRWGLSSNYQSGEIAMRKGDTERW